MADLIFIQRSWIGRRIFQLRSDRLTISGSLFGISGAQEIPLRSINPDYQRHARRFVSLIVGSLIFCGLALAAFTVLMVYAHPFTMGLALYALGFFAGGGILAMRGAVRTDFIVFFDHWNNPQFSLVRDPKQIAQFDAFVFELIDRIERIQNGLPGDTDAPAPPISAVVLPAADSPPIGTFYWRASITAGTISTVYPCLAKLFPPLAEFVLPVLLLSSTAGLYWGVASFITKEPRRRWSVLGLILSVAAPVLVLRAVALPFF